MSDLLTEYPKSEYPNGVNVRWLCCHVAFGRRPEAWEMALWNTDRWREFAASINFRKPSCYKMESIVTCLILVYGTEIHDQYNQWLMNKFPVPQELVSKGLS